MARRVGDAPPGWAMDPARHATTSPRHWPLLLRALQAPLHHGTPQPVIGYRHPHTAIDDYSGLACAEILTAETKETSSVSPGSSCRNSAGCTEP
jgi:hypothetical protein